MDLIYIIKDLINVLSNGGNIQDFINNRFKSSSKKVINPLYIDTVTTKHGITLPLSYYTQELEQALEDYDYSGISRHDIVLDLGANRGVFSLTAALTAKKVYAVEPLYNEELETLVQINKALNVKVLPFALSNQETITLSYDVRSKTVKGLTFLQIKKLCGGKIDFLKCDIEGAEWDISPQDFEGIRNIEMEVHNTAGQDLQDYVSLLQDQGYKVLTEKVPISNKLLLIHASKEA